MKENTKNVLNKILTVVVIALAALCVFLAVKIITGQDTSIFGYQVYHILTGSMEPTIPTGSTVITKQVDPYSLNEGDVITFVSRDAAIYGNTNTHRIIGIDDSSGERRFITKGDANGTVDSVEVPASDIKGKVVFHANFRAFSAFLDFMKTGYGFITVICLPFIFILWQISSKLKREIKEYAEENARAEAEAEIEKSKKEASAEASAEVSAEALKAAEELDFEKLKAIELAKLREAAKAAALEKEKMAEGTTLEEKGSEDTTQEETEDK